MKCKKCNEEVIIIFPSEGSITYFTKDDGTPEWNDPLDEDDDISYEDNECSCQCKKCPYVYDEPKERIVFCEVEDEV